MKEYLKKLPKEIRDLIHLAGNIAAKNNIQAYLVGGFVRDLILGVNNLDVDITVEGNGIKFAEEMSSYLKAKLTRHGRFGTATLLVRPDLKIDIATSRRETYPKPAHLPEVKSGDLKDDLFRRDFTINAMAISINEADFGRLIDYFGGKNDLAARKIRILHGLSFIDDPTRILRAVRFEARYDFKIEPQTLAHLKEAIKRKMLDKVEPQRIRDDLILVLKEKSPLKEIRRLRQLSSFSFIHPKLSVAENTYKLLAAAEQEIAWFGKDFHHRRQLDNWIIHLMVIMDCLNDTLIRNICRRFAFRKGDEKRIISYKQIDRKSIANLASKNIKPSEIFSMLEPLSYEVIIMLKAKYKNRLIRQHIKDFFEIYNGMRTYICGDDLCNLGVSPGPYYKKIFTTVLDAKLNGLVKTKEEELSLIKKLVKL